MCHPAKDSRNFSPRDKLSGFTSQADSAVILGERRGLALARAKTRSIEQLAEPSAIASSTGLGLRNGMADGFAIGFVAVCAKCKAARKKGLEHDCQKLQTSFRSVPTRGRGMRLAKPASSQPSQPVQRSWELPLTRSSLTCLAPGSHRVVVSPLLLSSPSLLQASPRPPCELSS